MGTNYDLTRKPRYSADGPLVVNDGEGIADAKTTALATEIAAAMNAANTPKPRHIGKSSFGWCFSLRVYPDEGINSLDDWKRLFAEPGAMIVDEYGHEHTVEDMLRRITERTGKVTAANAGGFPVHPAGLCRHDIDGRHCIAHPEGTYDLCVGEFS